VELISVEDVISLINKALAGDYSGLSQAYRDTNDEITFTERQLQLDARTQGIIERLRRLYFKLGFTYALKVVTSKYHVVDKEALRRIISDLPSQDS